MTGRISPIDPSAGRRIGMSDEVRAECRDFKAKMRKEGGFIFSPAQDIQADVPIENVEALLEVAREKG